MLWHGIRDRPSTMIKLRTAIIYSTQWTKARMDITHGSYSIDLLQGCLKMIAMNNEDNIVTSRQGTDSSQVYI